MATQPNDCCRRSRYLEFPCAHPAPRLLGLRGDGLASLTVCVLLACLAWLILGLLNAIRSRLAERLASWLLPAGQATTVRLAQGLALCASRIAPSHTLTVRAAEFEGQAPWRLFCPGLSASTEVCPAALAAQAEIEKDLEAEARVIAPVRLVLPILWAALADRLNNGKAYCSLTLRVSVAVLVSPLALILGLVSALLINAAAAAIVFTSPRDSLARKEFGPPHNIVKHAGDCILSWQAVLWGIPMVLIWLAREVVRSFAGRVSMRAAV